MTALIPALFPAPEGAAPAAVASAAAEAGTAALPEAEPGAGPTAFADVLRTLTTEPPESPSYVLPQNTVGDDAPPEPPEETATQLRTIPSAAPEQTEVTHLPQAHLGSDPGPAVQRQQAEPVQTALPVSAPTAKIGTEVPAIARTKPEAPAGDATPPVRSAMPDAAPPSADGRAAPSTATAVALPGDRRQPPGSSSMGPGQPDRPGRAAPIDLPESPQNTATPPSRPSAAMPVHPVAATAPPQQANQIPAPIHQAVIPASLRTALQRSTAAHAPAPKAIRHDFPPADSAQTPATAPRSATLQAGVVDRPAVSYARTQLLPRSDADPLHPSRTTDGEPTLSLRGDPALAAPQTVAQTLATLRPDLAPPAARQIAEAFQQAPNRPVDISLSPEELGRVRLSLTGTEATITVNILAERSETADLLRRHIQDLHAAFAALGYADISFSFAQRDQAAGDADTGETGHDVPEPAMPEDTSARHRITLTDAATGGVDLRL